jgi:pimeloyl-ACP methyl ester carboxylesterase
MKHFHFSFFITIMKKTFLSFLLLLVLSASFAQPIQIGSSSSIYENNGEPLTMFTYKPATYKAGPIIVVFHGVRRNAEDYRNFAITMGERFKAIIVTPMFDSVRFASSRYQRGGIMKSDKVQPKEKWTYSMIPGLVSHVRKLEKNDTLPYYLIGHSAGGQFLVRMAAFLPGEARRIVAANPGSDLFPTREQNFGYGFGNLPEALSNNEVLKSYLAAPLTLYLGTDDIRPEHNFDVSAAGMVQGKSRLERGRNCFAFAKALAEKNGWVFNWRKVETPDIDHDAARMFAAKEVEDALFGK